MPEDCGRFCTNIWEAHAEFDTIIGRLHELTFTEMHAPIIKEQWHGKAYREIPQFTIDWLRMANEKIVFIGENWMYKNKTGRPPGLTGLAWRDFSAAEMEAWISEAGRLKFGPKKAPDRLCLAAKAE